MKVRLRATSLPRTVKRPIALLIDTTLLSLATWVAYSLRLELLHVPVGPQWWAYALAPALALPIFTYFGLYRAIFRYSGLPALIVLAKAVALYGMLYSIVLLHFEIPDVPRTLGLLQPLLTLLFVGGWRAIVRLWFARGPRALRQLRRNVMIYGAGSAGRRLLSALENSPEMNVVGFIDDEPGLQGSSINGATIHSVDALPLMIERKNVSDVLLAIPSLTRARRNQILDTLRAIGVHVRTLPGLDDLAQGRVEASDVRELEIEDLLGRDPVQPFPELMRLHNADHVVLVTGAGGSIGAELCRQIATVKPSRMILVEHSEFALYTVHQDLSQKMRDAVLPACELVPLLCSVRDEARLDEIMGLFKPNIVYHAAAYKHVPLVEHNVVEGVRNNVLGTLVAARCALRAEVSVFVLISTDKAVRPTNVMGASKRLAEMILQAIAAAPDLSAVVGTLPRSKRTRFSMVRFGNVLGSSGSVVPLFRQQIRNGGPVTVTHPDVTRFFMTIPEAAQLVVQAGAMCQGGEVFVLDMGQPVRILDLARRMIELSGLLVRDDQQPYGDIEIVFTGLRPGEKLYEELLIGDHPLPTAHPRIMMARESFLPWADLAPRLRELEALTSAADHEGTRSLLGRLVVGFRPDSELVDYAYLESTGQPLREVTSG